MNFPSSTSPKPLAIIAGVGTGLGASIARRFAAAYTTVLLARKLEHLLPIEKGITDRGGDAFSVACDVSQPESVKNAFGKIEEVFPGRACAVAVFNATGPFVMKSVLDVEVEEFDKGYGVSMKGTLLFSQRAIPLLLSSSTSPHPPTLIFTGASASLKGSALFSIFSAPKFGLRSLAQSIAREFNPKGIHVCHAVIDGPLDVPWAKEYLGGKTDEETIDPEEVAETYWALHCQGRRGWSFEVDVRAMGEKW
ncbi:hypothetical protein M409DRAFT_62407 [Zasmidium cellare ATCC 36951]|uniref:NAD(P)-binding protein n=1 Tax=Zasmidium cellare ATCC 36951 TaxID=1080233 RepID=A0A6A6D0V9_ZASCE|nr:uncharacterized protein M409DRAFT_62407 [Zasmidium cellare ATCC 36951]KAF2172653.1 hypothetical protein M409DRAFT_62407 [Zasmidium cellare ATCC 36951]